MEHPVHLGQDMYELGVRLGGLGGVAIGCAGGHLARALARAAGCGASLAGGEVWFHDGSCAACAAWLGRYYAVPASLFLRQAGGAVTSWVLDENGRLLDPPPPPPARLPRCGQWDLWVGTDQAWAAHRAAGLQWWGAVSAQGPAGLLLTLERMGCALVSPAPGVPLLRADQDGFTLTLEQNGAAALLPGEDAPAAAAAWLSQGRPLSALVPRPRLL